MTWLLEIWQSKNKGEVYPSPTWSNEQGGEGRCWYGVCTEGISCSSLSWTIFGCPQLYHRRLITLDIQVSRRPPSISDSEALSKRWFYSYRVMSSSEEVCGASTVIRSSWRSTKAMPLTQWHSKGAVAVALTIPTAWTPTLPLALCLVRARVLGFLAEGWCDYGNSSLTNTSLPAFPPWSTYRSSRRRSGGQGPLDTQTVPCWSATSSAAAASGT